MIFIYNSKKYLGKTAVRIVRAIERDTAEYANKTGTIKDFLIWSLARMADRIPMRELEVSPHLPDETIAFNYLCLLDNYEIGAFYDTRSLAPGELAPGEVGSNPRFQKEKK
ncbi:MAG: hypothetical protein LH614_16350 [Pyrinomonadaceae bacterium]|nr:hypothetical protein [Pyrinomonadaceae bacterium]